MGICYHLYDPDAHEILYVGKASWLAWLFFDDGVPSEADIRAEYEDVPGFTEVDREGVERVIAWLTRRGRREVKAISDAGDYPWSPTSMAELRAAGDGPVQPWTEESIFEPMSRLTHSQTSVRGTDVFVSGSAMTFDDVKTAMQSIPNREAPRPLVVPRGLTAAAEAVGLDLDAFARNQGFDGAEEVAPLASIDIGINLVATGRQQVAMTPARNTPWLKRPLEEPK